MESDLPGIWRLRSFKLSLERPLVMGILNLTPDSFSDGGLFNDLDEAVKRARALEEQGADIIDIGGESTRPGAQPADFAEESRRVFPVIEALVDVLNIPISVDTSKPAIMDGAIRLGASLINDVNGFRAEGAIQAVADTDVGLCIMHMQGEPRTMQVAPNYQDVVSVVESFLMERVAQLRSAGVTDDRICIDPGFGFGKTLDHNIALIRNLQTFVDTGFPVLVGISRKSMIGQLTGRDVTTRLPGSLAANLSAIHRGAQVLRVHDVEETVDAIKVWCALSDAADG